jgi:tRNA pseudouridine38-40 synthase
LSSLRAALWLWYRGTNFRGWQRQVQGPTVQETVEAALVRLGVHAGLAACGRTDRGVHARQQVATLRVPAGTDVPALSSALQGEDWGCAAAALAPPGFHAQWSPSTKEYRYRLAPEAPEEGFAPYAWDVQADARLGGRRLDVEAMARALSRAVGTRDFFAFHAASSVRRPRTLESVELHRGTNGLCELRLRGGGFGRYQVRALVGGAALVATGQVTEESWRASLEEAVQFEGGMLAPAHGLILWAVHYGGRGPFDNEAGARLPDGPPFRP